MPERPFECTGCKKPITIHYTEIVGDRITRTVMCADCPQLEKKLYGKSRKAAEASSVAEKWGSLACGNCGTNLETVKMGQPLGCSDCYDVFSDVIIDELLKGGKISKHLTTNKRTEPIHIGRGPGETPEISSTLKLIALNEALDETLVREDYETAAMLRDQIEALKKKIKPNDRKE